MRAAGAFILSLLAGCAAAPMGGVEHGSRPPERGVVPAGRPPDAIVVAGVAFPTGTRVVTWDEPEGYDAYREACRFAPGRVLPARPATGCDTPRRYGSRRSEGGSDLDPGQELESLRRRIDRLVVHFDVCGTSRRCFEVLHDLRGLSVHFMLDLDGTIYQTLDVAERARHAGKENDRSVGVEIANIGCYAEAGPLAEWYGRDAGGRPFVTLPASLGDPGLRTPGFVARPARPELVQGIVHGRAYVQYDFTEEQYRALARLVAALHRALPRLAVAAPREADGRVAARLLGDDEDAFAGLVGHYHVSAAKVDPGPAFQWERVLEEARGLLDAEVP